MIQKDGLHYQLWLVGQICGQFSRVTLGRLGAEAGRTDRFTVDEATATDGGDNGPLRVRRLFRVVPAARQDSGPPLTEE